MRFTAEMYDVAIANLQEAKKQLENDGNCCSVCGDDGHTAWHCGFNPLVAMQMCAKIAKHSERLHDTLHQLAGYNFYMGEQLGPKKVVTPEAQMDAEASYLAQKE